MEPPGISSSTWTTLTLTLSFLSNFPVEPSPLISPAAGREECSPSGHKLIACLPQLWSGKSWDFKILSWPPLLCKESLTHCGALCQIPALFISPLRKKNLKALGNLLLSHSSLGIILLLDIFFMGVMFLGSTLGAAVIAQEASWTELFLLFFVSMVLTGNNTSPVAVTLLSWCLGLVSRLI